MQKLELNWIGKYDPENKINPEPRILLENEEYSYFAEHQGQVSLSENAGITDNMLIHGDNLLALKSLQQEYAGRVKCIYIDPPYNTGSAFEHYDDNLEHSTWLNLMKPRLELLRDLLSEDGSIWISIDDSERDYLKILCDEVFGRHNFVTAIAWRSADSSNNDSKKFSLDHNYILVYAKSNNNWFPNLLERTQENNKHYKNPDNDPRGPWFSGNVSSPNPRPNLRYTVTAPNGKIIAAPTNGWRWKKEKMTEMIQTGEVVFSDDGTRLIKKTFLAGQKGLAPSSVWFDIDDTGHNRQAKYELIKLFPNETTANLFKTPKPEKVIKKVLQIATNPGDLVLDSFLGSGTTAAVAHKMGRRWIGIELGNHAYTHCYPRLKAVVDGEQGGISKAVNWQGGGGFQFYELAPTLLEQGKYGNLEISDKYNSEMLAHAMAKHEGYTYKPDENCFWKQGHSGENNFIFTAAGYISPEYLDTIASELGENEYLLICAESFDMACMTRHKKIIVRPIPRMLLGRCEWGKDNYDLNIILQDIEDWGEDDDE